MRIAGMSMRLKFILVGLGCVLLTASWFLFVYKPQQSQVKDLRTQVQSTRDQVAALEVELLRLKGLQKQEPQLRAELARFADALPADPHMPQFILQLQEAARLSKVDFLSITPSLPTAEGQSSAAAAPPPTEGAAATPAPSASPLPSESGSAGSVPPAGAAPAASAVTKSIAVTLTTKGTFFEVEDYIFRLERLDRAVRVDAFTLSSDDSGNLQVSLQLKMFTAPAPKSSPTTPAAPGASPTPSAESA